MTTSPSCESCQNVGKLGKKGQEFVDNIYFSVYSQDVYVVLLC